MEFSTLIAAFIASGHSLATARAKTAQSILLNAVSDAGYVDNVSVKGGVVMSELANRVRRATLDMDIDFLHLSIADASVRKFIAALNRVAPCSIRIQGKIVPLSHQEYNGKRVNLLLSDSTGSTLHAKLGHRRPYPFRPPATKAEFCHGLQKQSGRASRQSGGTDICGKTEKSPAFRPRFNPL